MRKISLILTCVVACVSTHLQTAFANTEDDVILKFIQTLKVGDTFALKHGYCKEENWIRQYFALLRHLKEEQYAFKILEREWGKDACSPKKYSERPQEVTLVTLISYSLRPEKIGGASDWILRVQIVSAPNPEPVFTYITFSDVLDLNGNVTHTSKKPSAATP